MNDDDERAPLDLSTVCEILRDGEPNPGRWPEPGEGDSAEYAHAFKLVQEHGNPARALQALRNGTPNDGEPKRGAFDDLDEPDTESPVPLGILEPLKALAAELHGKDETDVLASRIAAAVDGIASQLVGLVAVFTHRGLAARDAAERDRNGDPRDSNESEHVGHAEAWEQASADLWRVLGLDLRGDR